MILLSFMHMIIFYYYAFLLLYNHAILFFMFYMYHAHTLLMSSFILLEKGILKKKSRTLFIFPQDCALTKYVTFFSSGRMKTSKGFFVLQYLCQLIMAAGSQWLCIGACPWLSEACLIHQSHYLASYRLHLQTLRYSNSLHLYSLR